MLRDWRAQVDAAHRCGSAPTGTPPDSPQVCSPLRARSAAAHPRCLFDEMGQWDALVDAALATLEARSLLRATRPIALAAPPATPQTFDGPGPWDRAAVEIRLDLDTLHQWLAEGQRPIKPPPLWPMPNS